MKKPFLVLCCIIISAVASLTSLRAQEEDLFASSDAEPDSTRVSDASPLMMFRPGERKAPDANCKLSSEEQARENHQRWTGNSAAGGNVGGARNQANINQSLNDDISQSIYTQAQIRVANLLRREINASWTLDDRKFAEQREWEATQHLATDKLEQYKRILTKSQQEKQVALQKLNSATARTHGEAYVDEAAYNLQIKKLAEHLAEANVEAASALLTAIKCRGTAAQKEAEDRLAIATATEKEAKKAFDEAPLAEAKKIEGKIEELKQLSIKNKNRAGNSSGFEKLLWEESVDRFNESIKYLNRVVAVVALENPEDVRLLWREAAAKSKEAAIQSQKSAETEGRGDDANSNKHNISGNSLSAESRLAVAQAEKIRARQLGDMGLADLWHDIVQHSIKAVEYFSEELKASEKKENHDAAVKLCWEGAGWGELCLADHLKKAIEAEMGKNLQEATNWRVVAQFHQKSIDSFIQGIGAAARDEETSYYERAGDILRGQAGKLGKAIEAEKNGKAAEAVKWREAAGLHQESVEFYTKAAADAGNKNFYWDSAGDALRDRAGKLGEAIEAEKNGKAAEAVKWREAADLHQASVKFYTAAAEGAGNSFCWDSAGDALRDRAEKLGKAIEAEKHGNPAEAVKWREAADFNQQSIEFYTKAAEAGDNYLYWDHAGDALQAEAGKLERAIEADRKKSTTAAAAAWRGAAEFHQQSVKYFVKAAEAAVAEKEDEAKSWDNAGSALRDAVNKMENAIEAEEENNLNEAKKWRDAATLHKRSREYFIKAAEAYAAEKKDEGKSLFQTGHALDIAADNLELSIEAEEKENSDEAAQWRGVAEIQQQAAVSYMKAAKEHAEEYCISSELDEIGETLLKRAQTLKQAIEAEKEGRPAEGLKWRAIAELQQQAIGIFTERTAKASFPQSYYRWQEGRSLLSMTDNLAKAIGAEDEGNAAEAEEWRMAAGLHQKSAVAYHEATRAYATHPNDENEYESYKKSAFAFDNAAIHIGASVEAENNSNIKAAQKYREAAKKYQQAAEIFERSGREYQSNNFFNWGKTKGNNSVKEAKILLAEAKQMSAEGDTEE